MYWSEIKVILWFIGLLTAANHHVGLLLGGYSDNIITRLYDVLIICSVISLRSGPQLEKDVKLP